MIKQRTRIPADRHDLDEPLSFEAAEPGSAASTEGRGIKQRARPFTLGSVLFVVAEVVLLTAIPVLAVLGGRSLLTSQAGEFVEAPGPSDPGWLAFVDPTPVSVIVEVLDERVTGLTLVVRSGPDAAGGGLVLIPASVTVDGRAFADRSPEDAASTLAAALELAIPEVQVADEGWWAGVVGEGLLVTNTDPVVVDGEPIAIGNTVVRSEQVPGFIGLQLAGIDPAALEFRRAMWWETLMATEVEGSTEGAQLLQAVQAGPWKVDEIPLQEGEALRFDPDGVDALLSDLVTLPVGALPGDRIQIRILDRAGTNDLGTVAAYLGSKGYEVLQIGNVDVFDEGSTQLLVPPGTSPDAVSALTELTGAGTLSVTSDDGIVTVLTLLLGPGFETNDGASAD